MSDDDPVVELRDVEVHFEDTELMGLGESSRVRAVDGVSLTIPENDIVALVGESGCGKTTLGKAAIGLQRPTSGQVLYRGQDFWETKDAEGVIGRFRGNQVDGKYSHEDMRRALQIIHQDPGNSLNSNYSVMSLLTQPLKRWQPGLDSSDRRARILGFLEFVGMTPPEDYANRYPHQLSGGEQQRVALIRTLLMNPDLILADEAISALDVSLRVETMELLLELQNQFNTSYLFISHDISNARYLAKKADGRIGIMYLGELVEIGPVDQIINNPQHPYTKVLLWATPDLKSQDTVEEPPVRSLDIPDPENPPEGCRFHTRCPEAREACRQEEPEPVEENAGHKVACFRSEPNHGYWSSEPLADEGFDDETKEQTYSD